MEHQKRINFLDNTWNELSKFRKKIGLKYIINQEE